MTAKRIFVVITLLLIGSLVYWASNCDSGGGPELASMVGTWVNTDYDSDIDKSGKLIINADGTWERYDNSFDIEPHTVGPYTITDTWGDSHGNTWIEFTVVNDQDITFYALSRINSADTISEGVYESSDYPSEIDTNDPYYEIYYRTSHSDNGPDNGPADETIIGTWANSEYNGPGNPAKITFHSDGTYDFYENIFDTEIFLTSDYTVNDKWTDASENTWYKIYSHHPDIYERYALCYVDETGNTVIGTNDPDDYPTEIDPVDYYIYYRQ